MDDSKYFVDNSLNRLKKYLNYQISTSILFFLSMQIFIFIFIVAAAAIIFTPYMLYVLKKENKKGWIVFFLILVIIPLVAAVLLGLTVKFGSPLLFIPLGLFYLYCFLLRYEVNDWVRERAVKYQYLSDKKEREEEMDVFMKKHE